MHYAARRSQLSTIEVSPGPPGEESTLLYSLPYNPPYSPAQNKTQ
jgi:hypothetical protein